MIKLDKDKVIVFMGSMNAMPMMYALELKKLGYEVIYFVDVSRKDTLSRPENHFPVINYPYPSWVVEFVLPSQILTSLFPKIFAAIYQRKLGLLTKKEIGCYVLNGFFTSLAPYLDSASNKVALSHGSDLDVWANIERFEILAKNFGGRSIFKYLPEKIVKILIKNIIKKQYTGYSQSEEVVYFPIGFNVEGDKLIRRLINGGVRYIPRYDISFEPLDGQSREFKMSSKNLEIFSGVRFLYRTFPGGNDDYNKGNDVIIEGIAKYYLINPNIRVHFVEKGEDVQFAKELCRKLGIESVVVWHKEMLFNELLSLYQRSDVCFDQVGKHWVGAIGGYALWLGKPLIANVDSAVKSGVWPVDNPVCASRNSVEVCEWLVKLQDVEFRKTVSDNSKKFVETYMGAQSALSNVFEFQD